MIFTDLLKMGQEAHLSALDLAKAPYLKRQKALLTLSALLEQEEAKLLEANNQDIENGYKAGLDPSLIDRLSLKGRIHHLASSVKEVAALPDPLGDKFDEILLPNGLNLIKQRVPIGVLGVIYEARPNVTIDVAALAILSGNSAILRGGKEALLTNTFLVSLCQKALLEAGLKEHVIQLITSVDRAIIYELLGLFEWIDLIIPRGGADLHKLCKKHSKIPVITGGIGICHLYVDEKVDAKRAIQVIHNAKTQRPTVCNALDTLLVHRSIASFFIPDVVRRLSESGVAFHLDSEAFTYASPNHGQADLHLAGSQDWDTEWLNLTLGIKVVESIEEAIDHIQKHSSGHSDGILSDQKEACELFVNAIDSAAVYVNASTRFTDGGEFGMGAEVAISTQKIHARGPMGLKELTSYKWIIHGNYHIRG